MRRSRRDVASPARHTNARQNPGPRPTDRRHSQPRTYFGITRGPWAHTKSFGRSGRCRQTHRLTVGARRDQTQRGVRKAASPDSEFRDETRSDGQQGTSIALASSKICSQISRTSNFPPSAVFPLCDIPHPRIPSHHQRNRPLKLQNPSASADKPTRDGADSPAAKGSPPLFTRGAKR
jgi:hypothetical protein